MSLPIYKYNLNYKEFHYLDECYCYRTYEHVFIEGNFYHVYCLGDNKLNYYICSRNNPEFQGLWFSVTNTYYDYFIDDEKSIRKIKLEKLSDKFE